MHALKGLALPRAIHSGEIAMSGSRRLRPTLATAPVLFAHALSRITVAKSKQFRRPYLGNTTLPVLSTAGF